MKSRIVAVLILGGCSLWCAAGTEEPGVGSPPTCPSVLIDLPEPAFKSPGYVRAVLKSGEADVVYLASRAFRVQRQTPEGWIPATPDLLPSTIAEKRPASYTFTSPRLVGIQWSDVGEARATNSYVVHAGRYRLILFYTAKDPAKGSIHWCSATSKEFLLERDGTLYSTQ